MLTSSEIDFIRNEFIPALRSGKYKQCAGRFCRKNSDGTHSYCVMGVGLSLRGLTNEKLIKSVCYDEDIFPFYKMMNAIIPEHFIGNKYVSLNNDRKATLPELADIIERDLEEYLKNNS